MDAYIHACIYIITIDTGFRVRKEIDCLESLLEYLAKISITGRDSGADTPTLKLII